MNDLATKRTTPSNQIRRRVGLLLFFLSFVTYLDRVNISVAGVPLAHQFGFSRVQLGTIFSGFLLGYTLFQIPAGWMGDRFGHKKIMILAVVWWSVFTALTAVAGYWFLVSIVGTIASFWIVRFFIGLGEAATFPCANGLIAQWFTAGQRGSVTGFMYAGVGIGTALTPPLITWLMVRAGWQSAFYISSLIGILLAAALYLGIPRRSTSDPDFGGTQEFLLTASGSSKPLDNHDTGLRQLLGNSTIWLLTIGIFMLGYVVNLYYFWFFIYLIDVRGFSLLTSSFASSGPFLTMAISAPAGGFLADHLIGRLGRTRARRAVAVTGMTLAGLFIVLGTSVDTPVLATAFLSLGAGSVYLAVTSYFAVALDISPSYSATAASVINTGANLGGAVSPTLTPWIATRYGWTPALHLAAGISLTAAILWFFVRPQDGEQSNHDA
jgi:MFS transporter, ACS family, glucarate transporter